MLLKQQENWWKFVIVFSWRLNIYNTRKTQAAIIYLVECVAEPVTCSLIVVVWSEHVDSLGRRSDKKKLDATCQHSVLHIDHLDEGCDD
jgi:hypothetical protein